MDDDRRVVEPHLAKDELPTEGNASGAWFVIIGFTLAAVFATFALWPLESDLLATQLPLVLCQLVVSAVIWVGLLWMVYSGFMDRHMTISLVLGVALFGGGWGLQELAARLMGTDNPSFIAIAVGSWLGVVAFYGWWGAIGRLKTEKLENTH
jgi:hypothetical protein